MLPRWTGLLRGLNSSMYALGVKDYKEKGLWGELSSGTSFTSAGQNIVQPDFNGYESTRSLTKEGL